MSDFFVNRRIVVTGGGGFLGSHVVKRLEDLGCKNILVPRSSQYDLTKPHHIQQMYNAYQPDIVIHLAAVVGGIGANQRNPGKYFFDNLIMGSQLMEVGRHHGLEKFVAVGTVCSYPKHCPVPFREDDLWNGYPEETNAPYGLAKKMMLVQSQAYRQQYGFNSIFLMPANLYGPGDNFDLETSHVIPALIRKCLEAIGKGEESVSVWGDGSATREFLYVRDAAEGILLATECYNESIPVNLGTGQEISIKELAEKICQTTGFTDRLDWETSKPNGQPRRVLDISRAREKFGFTAQTSIEYGLLETVNWYRDHGRRNF